MSRRDTPTPEPFPDSPTARSEVPELLAGSMYLAEDPEVEDFTEDARTDPDAAAVVEQGAEPERAPLAPLSAPEELSPELAEAWAGALGAVYDALIEEGISPAVALRCVGCGVSRMRERLRSMPISVGAQKRK